MRNDNRVTRRDDETGSTAGEETVIDLRTATDDADDGLLHWTEPATGEVPMAVASEEDGSSSASGPGSPPAPRWRSNNFGRSDHDVTSFEDLGDASRLGARTEDLVEDDAAPFPPLGRPKGDHDSARDSSDGSVDGHDEPAAMSPGDDVHGHRFRADPGDPTEEAPVRQERLRSLDSVSLTKRVVTGAAFAVAALAAFASGPSAILVLLSVVLLLAAVEYFDAIRRVGFRPATILGLLAVFGLIAGTYARGEAALPLVLTLSVVFTFLWYLLGVIKDRPTANIALTLLGVVWVGVLGSFAALLLRMPDREGVAFLAGAILVTIAYDTAAYLGGTLLGRHKLSFISPNKSWEGAAAGTLAALLVGGVVVALISPWSVTSALLLALMASILVPLGDLAESNIKRDLGLKDMGRILPGHGGVLDRFDGMLLVLPATYYLVQMIGV